MMLLLDTNVLLRLGDGGHAQHGDALAAVDGLDARGIEGVLVPQVLYEYWVVATRPVERNGLGMSATTAATALMKWQAAFRLLLDERGVFARWRDLVVTHAVLGKTAHDARLVAAMQRHGVTHLLTFNTPDFRRFAGLQVVSPADLLAGHWPV